ncbi:hypothetical protein [Carnobacterium viridans]|uniref:hypothetical protein n=1 Tax=Carnobacterium viridans TaxID=174587 RepID=UPI000ADF0CB0|nr:hypothetical protein [Carnobacterium viridans]
MFYKLNKKALCQNGVDIEENKISSGIDGFAYGEPRERLKPVVFRAFKPQIKRNR